MVAKPPGGRPEIVDDEPVPSELLRPAEPGPSLIAPPGRGTPAPGLTAAPACLAAAPCRGAAPPVHLWAACFVCCMMSLLFLSYLLFAPGNPTASFLRIGSKLPLSHTFHEHSRVARPPDSLLPSDATRTAIDQFLWCHPRKQNGHTRHLVATKVGAVVFATSERKRRSMWARIADDCDGIRVVSGSSTQCQAGMPDAHS